MISTNGMLLLILFKIKKKPIIKIIDFGEWTNSYLVEDIAIYTLYTMNTWLV
jgi:hypothetical protein